MKRMNSYLKQLWFAHGSGVNTFAEWAPRRVELLAKMKGRVVA